MICPECNHENTAGTTFCTQCGAVLTQSSLTASAPNRTNQVWNTEIEQKQNRANSRVAMIVLGASALLLLGLIIALCSMLSSPGDSLTGQREQGQSFLTQIDEFLDFVADTKLNFGEAVPEAYASIAEGTDEDYIELFEEFLEKAYNDDYADLPRLAERYYDEFADINVESFSDRNLALCSARTVQALDKIRRGSYLIDAPMDPAVTHTILQLEGNVELYTVVSDLYENYGILYYEEHIPDFYIRMLPIYRAQLEVEYDLTAQLIGAEASYTEGDPAPYLSYTNYTPYELDLTIYNDYYMGTDFYSDTSDILSLMPGETAIIPLVNMPTEYEDWYTHWYVHTYYLDGLDIYDYYW